jgi:hypothetical protein
MVGSQVQQPRRQVLLGHGSWRRDVREGCALCVRELPPCLGWLLRRVLGAARVKLPRISVGSPPFTMRRHRFVYRTTPYRNARGATLSLNCSYLFADTSYLLEQKRDNIIPPNYYWIVSNAGICRDVCTQETMALLAQFL